MISRNLDAEWSVWMCLIRDDGDLEWLNNLYGCAEYDMMETCNC
jgi:hypothetical protein